MEIKNFTAGYSVEEDRLLLEISGSQVGQRYWVTRRALLALGEAINRILKTQYDLVSAAAHAPGHVQAFANFGQQAAAEKLPVASHPTASLQSTQNTPLIHEIGYQAIDQEHGFLKLVTHLGAAHEYRLTRDVLHALLNLLNSQAARADWGVDLLPGLRSANKGAYLAGGGGALH